MCAIAERGLLAFRKSCLLAPLFVSFPLSRPLFSLALERREFILAYTSRLGLYDFHSCLWYPWVLCKYSSKLKNDFFSLISLFPLYHEQF